MDQLELVNMIAEFFTPQRAESYFPPVCVHMRRMLKRALKTLDAADSQTA